MLDGVPQNLVTARPAASRLEISRQCMFALGLFVETAIVVALSIGTGIAYHQIFHGDVGPVTQFLSAGLLVAIVFQLPLVLHSHYRTEHELAGRRSIVRIAHAWTYAFFCVAVIALMTKTGGTISRGWLVLFFGLGLGCVVGFEIAMRKALSLAANHGVSVATRRLIVIGSLPEIERFRSEHARSRSDIIQIVAAATLPDSAWQQLANGQGLDGQIDSTVDIARTQGVTDVVILACWTQSAAAMRISELFLDMPVAVHLGQIDLVEHFPAMRAATLGSARTLVLRNEPLSMLQVTFKRAFDILASAAALLALTPFFLVVALLIKLDSPGPAFFQQHRRGFNLKEFRIWKFRTMSTLDDGDVIPQAKREDERVTRLGRILRRWNIDELPQLINVMLGDMSLVGPRPHAVAHDRYYERVIAGYARRLNVKPGITGWAQVNGFRGATEKDSDMQARVELDLHYIENWSIGLDIYILLKTVFSPLAYKNAH